MSYTLSDFWKSRIHLQRQPSPILCLYELALPDSTFLRVVDFQDPEVNLSAPDEITFDGKQFSSRRVHRTAIKTDAESIRPQLGLTVADPGHTAAYYVRQYNGLKGQDCTLWITTYDNLGTPADAITETWKVQSAVVIQRPPSVTISLGMRNLFEQKYPKIFYDRRRCYNSWQDRYTPGNWCTYPSNEFGPSTEQDYHTGGVDEERERQHGWYTQQAERAYAFASNDSDRLKIEVRATHSAWYEALRHGPYLYRFIDGDFDAYTAISSLITTRDLWSIGILIQDSVQAAPDPEEENPPPVPVSSWLLWGTQDDGAASRELLERVTDDDVTTDTTVASTDTHLRVVRSGDDFTMYSRDAEGSSWTQRATETLTLPSTVRVGVAVSSLTQSTDAFGGYFDYLRFTAGGLTSCERTQADCVLHKNLFQFNGYLEIPNDRARA